ncbi:putative transmembrane protein [Senna tora]|uniref:Putative transmembrane protein n=1 Tax=Senna tora TaxID=362788 RepID=A0A834WI26_9FABA|nr:putative transmembrane protein [Senna tora]
MQQRTSSLTSCLSSEHRAINVADQPQTKRRRIDSDNGKREVSLLRSAEKWLHAIPVILMLCIFLLWWDGRTMAISKIVITLPNTTRIDLTILAVSAMPIPSVPQNLSSDDETYLDMMSVPI